MQKKDYTLDEWGVLRINEGVTEIEEDAFTKDKRIKKLILPDSLREIGEMAFADCSDLSEVEFNEGLFYIGRKAFCGTAVEQLEFPASLRSISSLAFQNCEKLTSVKFGNSINFVGTFSFHSSAVRSIVFPEGTGEFSSYALSDCDELEYLECDGLVLNKWHHLDSKNIVVAAYVAGCLNKNRKPSENVSEYIKEKSRCFLERAVKKRNPQLLSYLISEKYITVSDANSVLKESSSAEINALLLGFASSFDEDELEL